jgi:hypothetical protein
LRPSVTRPLHRSLSYPSIGLNAISSISDKEILVRSPQPVWHCHRFFSSLPPEAEAAVSSAAMKEAGNNFQQRR